VPTTPQGRRAEKYLRAKSRGGKPGNSDWGEVDKEGKPLSKPMKNSMRWKADKEVYATAVRRN
jgi:hypothetical protein